MSYSHHSYSQSSSTSQSPPSTTPQKQYPTAHATSSAFSASANANEDWTKISDLAERRRIQNRIAQRNYRKKLKKRLEELEKRAGSSSASPEQSPRQLAEPEFDTNDLPATTSRGSRRRPDRTPELRGAQQQQSYVLSNGNDDRGMFAQQFTRQLSTSPPPFSYATNGATMPTTTFDGYQPYQLQSHHQQLSGAYCTTGAGLDMPLYPHYMAAAASMNNYTHQPAIKQEYYADDESSPFSIGYASMAAGSTTAAPPSYHDVPAYTPSLTSESFDSGSPPELCWPTPGSMPGTPPLYGHV